MNRDEIQVDLVKIANGERVLRLTDPHLGLSLEKKLDASLPVAQQKESLFRVFEAALARAELIPA
jgi:hypothetical protein